MNRIICVSNRTLKALIVYFYTDIIAI